MEASELVQVAHMSAVTGMQRAHRLSSDNELPSAAAAPSHFHTTPQTSTQPLKPREHICNKG